MQITCNVLHGLLCMVACGSIQLCWLVIQYSLCNSSHVLIIIVDVQVG